MESDRVVKPLDVVEEVRLRFPACLVPGEVHALDLERAQEALHHRVVVAVPLPAHAGTDSEGPEELLVIAPAY